MRFKLKEETQRTFLRVILSLNLIVLIDEMSAIEHVGRLTFAINGSEAILDGLKEVFQFFGLKFGRHGGSQ